MSNKINTEDLSSALAEAMGWTTEVCGDFYSGRRPWWKDAKRPYPYVHAHEDFKPHISHDHAQLAVEECFKQGVIQEYYKNLMDLIRKRFGFDCKPILVLRALPEEQARAALAALAGKAIKE